MRTHVRRMLCATAIAGGFTVLGFAFATQSASAAEAPGTTSGVSGLVSGNQTGGHATAPVDASDNQVTVIGDNNTSGGSTDQGGRNDTASSSGPSSSGDSTSGAGGIGSGNQTDAGATAPVDASDNQITVIGEGNTNDSTTSGDHQGTQETRGTAGDTTSGSAGDGSGNQTDAQAGAPVHASGNQVTVIGDDQVADVQPGDNGVEPSSGTPSDAAGAGPAAGDETSGADGTGSGNQTDAGVTAPVDASGNQVTVIGDDNNNASSSGSGASTGSGDAADETSGADGTGSGNQTDAAALVPVDATGNQVTVIGDGNSSENTAGNSGSANDGAADTTTGDDGTVAGNQTGLGTVVPVDASGNQVTVIGDGNTSTGETTAGDGPAAGEGAGGGTGNTTSGTDGTGSGNQTDAGAAAPVDATGNQVTVIGDGNAAENTTPEGDTGGTTAGNETSGEDGTGSGNQTEPALTAPVDTGDNQVTVIGDDNTSESTDDETGTGGSGGDTTDGEDGTGSGNQTAPGIEAPIETAGNQITIIGDGNSTERDTESNTGEEDTDEPGEGPAGGTGGDTDDESTSGGTGTDGSTSAPASAAASSLPQAGPAASVAGALPQTGAAAGLLLWGAFGLALLMLGTALIASQRRRPVGARPVREVHLAG